MTLFTVDVEITRYRIPAEASVTEADIYRKALADIVDQKPRWWRAWAVAREALRAGLECRS